MGRFILLVMVVFELKGRLLEGEKMIKIKILLKSGKEICCTVDTEKAREDLMNACITGLETSKFFIISNKEIGIEALLSAKSIEAIAVTNEKTE
jgi:hypothetical protein